MNEYFQAGSTPAPSSPGASAAMRSEFASIASAFDKLPVMAGSPNEFVVINATGTALISSGFVFADLATVDGVQTLTNKTISWGDNSWVGFGTGATKNAGTGADQVLLLAEAAKLPALDGSNLTNLNQAQIGTVSIAHGGTGANDLTGAQNALGINLKADSFNAVLTGAPVGPTPSTGDNSPRLATTLFVNDAVAAVGGATPSNATPLMNGVAGPGNAAQVSRDNHIHPSDTSRAKASAETAAGTSFTPTGTISATTVQAAIAELDTETQASLALKASLVSPVFTGDPRAPTVATSDNDTSIATTAFVQTLLAQQPPGTQVSNATPLMNGVANAGTGIEASRFDHIHPVDTSRAPLASPTFTGTVGGITKAMVGLGNADNTADASKPVSTAQAVSIATKVGQTSSTGAALIPAGTTAQRDGAPGSGYTRFNSDITKLEYYDGSAWSTLLGTNNPVFTGTVTSPRNYNVSGVTGALQVNGSDVVKFDATGITLGAGRRLAQILTFQTGAVATGTTLIPNDNTIPQNTEGDQYLSLSITPTNVSSTLEIDVEVNGSASNLSLIGAALFIDSGVSAVVAKPISNPSAGYNQVIPLKFLMIAGTLSTMTFKVRAGSGSAGTFTLNGTGGNGQFGGVMYSRITIKEYLP